MPQTMRILSVSLLEMVSSLFASHHILTVISQSNIPVGSQQPYFILRFQGQRRKLNAPLVDYPFPAKAPKVDFFFEESAFAEHADKMQLACFIAERGVTTCLREGTIANWREALITGTYDRSYMNLLYRRRC
jgi:hypothetical protein